ncbi:flavodoxin domain-containing protein [Thauera humireducens]|uniref:flavodoxin domain-containing protein n=1 Tax=Thauera humireducens TaxID=1134435 RepID=UPI00311DC986
MIALELPRLGAAAGIVTAYAALCVRAWRNHRVLTGNAGGTKAKGVLVAYASQSGFAQELAVEATHALDAAGILAHRRALNEVDGPLLSQCDLALFIVSTCGEGDAPDNGALFARRLMSTATALNGLRYGLLALGDSSYANYCGFGRRLDDWLASSDARAIFPRIEVRPRRQRHARDLATPCRQRRRTGRSPCSQDERNGFLAHPYLPSTESLQCRPARLPRRARSGRQRGCGRPGQPRPPLGAG